MDRKITETGPADERIEVVEAPKRLIASPTM